LLGLYAFGLFLSKRQVNDKLVPFICLVSPAICYYLSTHSAQLMGGYVFDNELIIVNGLITFGGLLITSKKKV
jgi:hypothetical protein